MGFIFLKGHSGSCAKTRPQGGKERSRGSLSEAFIPLQRGVMVA